MLYFLIVQTVHQISKVGSAEVLGVIEDPECAMGQVLIELLVSIVRDGAWPDRQDMVPEGLGSQQRHQPGEIPLS